MEAGILSESDHVELIDGEVIEVSPIGSRHAACVDRLNRLFNKFEDVIVRVQSPIRLDDFSEPQPDVTLLRPRPDFYAQGHPAPSDVLPLYAEAMIPELWLVNLPEEKIEIFSGPADSTYQEAQELRRGESATSRALPGLSLSADSILG